MVIVMARHIAALYDDIVPERCCFLRRRVVEHGEVAHVIRCPAEAHIHGRPVAHRAVFVAPLASLLSGNSLGVEIVLARCAFALGGGPIVTGLIDDGELLCLSWMYFKPHGLGFVAYVRVRYVRSKYIFFLPG